MNLENTKKWAKDKDGISSFMAILVGMTSSAIQDIYTSLAKQNIYSLLSKNDIKVWIKLYKKHRLIYNAIYQIAQKKGNNILRLKDIKSFLSTMLVGTPTQRKKLVKSMNTIKEEDAKKFAKAANTTLNTLLENIAQDKLTPNKTQESVPLEIIFFFKIHVYCWMEYREHFHIIYRKARQGNYKAIEKLLRIDPLILNDKFIRASYTTAPQPISHKLHNAYNNPRRGLLEISKIKSSVCGFISAFFGHIGQQQLTPLQIRELFNSFARDFEREPIDEDLPEEYDAFRKAVKRHHKLWLPIIQTSFRYHS